MTLEREVKKYGIDPNLDLEQKVLALQGLT